MIVWVIKGMFLLYAPISNVVWGETCPLTGVYMILSVVCKDSQFGSFVVAYYEIKAKLRQTTEQF